MKRWALALLIFSCCTALYLLTLTEVHTYDALSYILDVDRKPWRELFHPHHLAYGPLGALIKGVATDLGRAGSAERLLQGANALAGACGAALFGLVAARAASGMAPRADKTSHAAPGPHPLTPGGKAESRTLKAETARLPFPLSAFRSQLSLRERGNNPFTSVLRHWFSGVRSPTLAGATAALLLATSYAYWYYAVEVEVYTIAAVFLVVCLGLMLAVARAPSPLHAAALGAAQGGAVLFHQTNVLLCAPALVALAVAALAGDEGPRTTDHGPRTASSDGHQGRGLRHWPLVFRLLMSYALPLALVVGGAYLWVGLGVSGFRSWGELTGWVAGYATTGLWGGPVDGAKLGQLGEGLADSLAQPGGALVGLALLGVLLSGWRLLGAAPPGVVAVCLSWLLVYGAFFLWWEPDNIEFWIASLPPFYLLAVLAGFAPPARPGVADRLSAIGYRLSAIALVACGLVMLGVNYGAITRRGDAERDLQRVTARALAERSAPGDLLVLPDGLLELYMPFYEGRDSVASLSQAMAATGGDWPAACGLLRARIEGAMASGYAVLIGPGALMPAPAPPGEPPTPAERFGLSPDTVAACYEPLQPALEALPMGSPVPDYYRIPGAQALADGPGWDFTRSRWGWQVANAEDVTSTGAGLALRPAADPALTSPPVRLDSARYGAVEVRLAADTAARDAQLFFLDEQGQLDEARSIRWTLAAGPQPETYHLDLSEAVGWQGVVTGLRLDPVGVGDGGTVVVESIRLVP